MLGATAVAKVAGLLLHSPLLAGTDPLTGLSLRVVAAAGVVAEGALLIAILRGVETVWVAGVVLVFATAALAYRVWILAPGAACPCLGGISRWLPWLAVYERNVVLAVTLWLLLSSGGVLVHRRVQSQAV